MVKDIRDAIESNLPIDYIMQLVVRLAQERFTAGFLAAASKPVKSK